jgi:galactoside 2-L-fucosyltransferase 1/2
MALYLNEDKQLLHQIIYKNTISHSESQHNITFYLQCQEKRTTLLKGERHPTIYIRGLGRLGNNMFQVASGIGIAKLNNRTLVIDPNTHKVLCNVFSSSILNQYYTTGAVPQFTKQIYEKDHPYFDYQTFSSLPEIDLQINKYLMSWKYFSNISDEIHSLFTSQLKYQKISNAFLLKISNKSDITFVGVHIRRGDFDTKAQFSSGARLPNMSYIIKAMNYYRHIFPSVHFVVCSDSPKWCTQHLAAIPNVTISYRHSREVDFTLLTKCNHTIVTIGTFGWWAGYLTRGRVVYFDEPYAGKLQRRNAMMMKDYYLPNWIPMGN